MNVQKQYSHMFDFVFILALFCVFSASAFLAVVIGANVYKTTTENMDTNYTSRTASAYITEKIRHNDTAGAVDLTTIDDTLCLTLEKIVNDISYTTYIYHYDGNLMELFIKTSDTPLLSSGESILPVKNFSAEKVSPSLYSLTVKDMEDRDHSFYISLQSDDGKKVSE